MSTRRVAEQLVDMCREGQYLDAIDQLYDEGIISREMNGVPNQVTTGQHAVALKSAEWLKNVVKFHTSKVSDPIVAGEHFSVTMEFDVTLRDRGRTRMEEVCVFQVTHGKIVTEQFFYAVPG